MFIDTHCHIYEEYYEDIDVIMDKIKDSNIGIIINNAVDYKSGLEVLELSNKYSNMYCALGLHPENDYNDLKKVLKLLEDNIKNKKLVAVGEIGLDYNFNKDNKADQIELLKIQLDFAQNYNLPVIIHSREATEDIINILSEYKLKGIIHCFNGSVETAKRFIKMGYYLGINGVVTFKNCKLINVYKKIGIDNIVFETDSPYLTPVPHRGQRNDPSYINDIVLFLSDNLEISTEKLLQVSNENLRKLFDIY